MQLIQSHILKVLTLQETARYRDMKPKNVESNRFAYHLKCLIEDGLLGKRRNEYFLTAAGNRYADKVSLETFQPRFQPKIVTVIICTNMHGEYLLMTRKRKPLYGRIAFPYGKIHYGEKIGEAAIRELKEKTGLSTHLIHCGDMYLSVRENSEVVVHMLCHIFFGRNPVGTLITKHSTHSISWGSLAKENKKSFIPGFLDMNKLRLRHSKSKNRFFVEMVT